MEKALVIIEEQLKSLLTTCQEQRLLQVKKRIPPNVWHALLLHQCPQCKKSRLSPAEEWMKKLISIGDELIYNIEEDVAIDVCKLYQEEIRNFFTTLFEESYETTTISTR